MQYQLQVFIEILQPCVDFKQNESVAGSVRVRVIL